MIDENRKLLGGPGQSADHFEHMRRRMGGDQVDEMMDHYSRREKRATSTARIIGYAALGIFLLFQIIGTIVFVVFHLSEGCGPTP